MNFFEVNKKKADAIYVNWEVWFQYLLINQTNNDHDSIIIRVFVENDKNLQRMGLMCNSDFAITVTQWRVNINY